MMDCVAIVSGGMDSVTLLYRLVKQENRHPAVVTFLYGQKHAREIECAHYHTHLLNCEQHEIVDLAPFSLMFSASALVSAQIEIPEAAAVEGDPQPATYVPNRNMIFLSIATAYAESLGLDQVYYGAQRHDLYGYWDCTPDFLTRMNGVLALNRKRPVQIAAPYMHYSKAEILREGFALGVAYDKTWSCYNGGEVACGHCPTCAERLAAFAEIGIPDPLPYAGRR